MKILCDANIFLAVVMNEPEKKIIIDNTFEAELISPLILPYEIGNALSAMIKKKRIKEKEVKSLFSLFDSIPVRLVPVEIEAALDLAISYNIYAYDAYYLEVAKRLRLPLMSLDGKMLEVAKNLSIRTMEII